MYVEENNENIAHMEGKDEKLNTDLFEIQRFGNIVKKYLYENTFVYDGNNCKMHK